MKNLKILVVILFFITSCDKKNVDIMDNTNSSILKSTINSGEEITINLFDYSENNKAYFNKKTVNFENWNNTVYDHYKMRFDFGNLTTDDHSSYLGQERTYILNSGGTQVLKIEMPVGEILGNSGIITNVNIVPKKEAYLYYRVWFESDFDWTEGSKFMGFGGGTCNTGGNSAKGEDGWSFRLNFHESGIDSTKGDVYAYVYHEEMADIYGENLGLKTSNGVLQRNKWHGIQLYVKMNDTNMKNGAIKIWIDGVVVGEKDDIKFRNGISQIEKLLLHIFPGGGQSCAPDHTQYIRINEITWW